MNILVTGGAGFIGSHTIIELYKAGHTAVVVDNLSNSNPESLRRVSKILGGTEIPFFKVDIRDRKGLDKVLEQYKFDACIHFAGLKAVGESGVCTNPYGWTKSMLEQVLTDMQFADKEWNVVLLRYFNPIGAHESGLIGENPNGIPNNLMPYVTQVAVGKRDELGVFGNDYDTPDGTGVRDYIHVVDLARGHVCALKAIERKCGLGLYNLGTGHGYSVLDVVKAFERVNGVKVPYSIKPRRPGDIATCYSDPSKAERELGWKAQYGLDEMVRDSWNWQRQNPNGF